jgi:hypothetical protein
MATNAATPSPIFLLLGQAAMPESGELELELELGLFVADTLATGLVWFAFPAWVVLDGVEDAVGVACG